MGYFKPTVFATVAAGLILAGCGEATTAAVPEASISEASSPAPVPAQQSGGLTMPSPQQKRAMAAQYDPRRSVFSMFPAPPPDPRGMATAFSWSQGETLEAQGFLLQYLESPVGSAAERQGWDGVQRYYALYLQRISESRRTADRQMDDRAAQVARDEPEVRSICTRFRAERDRLTYRQALAMRDRLDELAVEYPSPLSQCQTALGFHVLDLMPTDCEREPCLIQDEGADPQ